jgi:hypothetical protein
MFTEKKYKKAIPQSKENPPFGTIKALFFGFFIFFPS